jgi:RNA polymerase sigma-70 factor (ECF subfamily)
MELGHREHCNSADRYAVGDFGNRGSGNLPHAMTESDPEVQTAIEVTSYDELVRTVKERRAQLVRMAQRMTRSREDAEDVVQESVLKAFNGLSRFRGEARMDTWVRAIVVNTARSWLRSQRGRMHVPLDPGYYEDQGLPQPNIPHPGKSPEESCDERELNKLLLIEIGSLRAVYGKPIQMCHLEEHSYVEAAQALHLNVATLKARLFRGRALLKRRFAGHARSRKSSPRSASPTGVSRELIVCAKLNAGIWKSKTSQAGDAQ